MTAGLMERKKDVRLRTGLPDSLEKLAGMMRDMSASGAFFCLSGAQTIGETVRFSIGPRPDGSGMVWKFGYGRFGKVSRLSGGRLYPDRGKIYRAKNESHTIQVIA